MTFFAETRHSFGHTALLLSGGANFGKFHFGVLKALHEYDLFPRTVCGASVGSCIAAAICSRPYERLTEIFNPEYVFDLPILKFLQDSLWDTSKGLLQG